jgi:hypothetical protein
MYFQAPERTLRSGAHPNSTNGANDSAYSSRLPRAAPAKAGRTSIPSTSDIEKPSSRIAVGATSARLTASGIDRPPRSPAAPMPGPLMTSGTRSVVS